MAISGSGHAGMSIYRDGKRIPVSFRISDAAGKVVQEGPITYG